MPIVRVQFFSVSLDGFGTGEGLSREEPFGHAGERLHEWMFQTRWWHELQGEPGGTGGIDDAFVRLHGPDVGAEIMGAGKFGCRPGRPPARDVHPDGRSGAGRGSRRPPRPAPAAAWTSGACTLRSMPTTDDPAATVRGRCRLAVAVQGLDHLDGLEVDYEGLRIPDGSVVAWVEHEGTVLGISVMPDGGGILMGAYPDVETARRAARRARAVGALWQRDVDAGGQEAARPGPDD